MLLSSEKPLER